MGWTSSGAHFMHCKAFCSLLFRILSFPAQAISVPLLSDPWAPQESLIIVIRN